MRTTVTLCVALMLLLAGCGSAAPAAGPAEASLDFHGATVDGAAFDGASLAGTPVVLWFWAPF